jgi:hypothetical protein
MGMFGVRELLVASSDFQTGTVFDAIRGHNPDQTGHPLFHVDFSSHQLRNGHCRPSFFVSASGKILQRPDLAQ